MGILPMLPTADMHLWLLPWPGQLPECGVQPAGGAGSSADTAHGVLFVALVACAHVCQLRSHERAWQVVTSVSPLEACRGLLHRP